MGGGTEVWDEKKNLKGASWKVKRTSRKKIWAEDMVLMPGNSIAFPPRLWINSGETSFRIYYSPFVECIFTRNKLPVRFWNKVSLASLIAAITKLFSQILRRLKKLNFPFIKRTDSLLPHINSSFSSSSSSLFFRKIHNSFALVWNFAVEEKQFQ